jgi:hypothetical protein
MNRREILRQGGATLAVLSTAGLAGCSSDDGGNDGGDDGGGDDGSSDDGSSSITDDDGSEDQSSSDGETDDETSDGDEEPTQVENCPRDGVDSADVTGQFDGSVVSNSIDGIEVQSLEASIQSDEQGGESFEVLITVMNTGDQTTHAQDYTYDLTVYDDSCTVLEIPGVNQYGISQDMAPGDTGRLFIAPTSSEFSLDNIAAFEVSVSCAASFADGVYCPDDS